MKMHYKQPIYKVKVTHTSSSLSDLGTCFLFKEGLQTNKAKVSEKTKPIHEKNQPNGESATLEAFLGEERVLAN